MLAITNTADGEARIREIYGDQVVVIPYVMPGFDLARLCAERFPREAGPNTIGMVLMKHGIFSFGATAQRILRAHDRAGELAEEYLGRTRRLVPSRARRCTSAAQPLRRQARGACARDIAAAAGDPMVMRRHPDARTLAVRAPRRRRQPSPQGPATPDHVIRTKRVPMIGRDVGGYASAYRAYFDAHAPRCEGAEDDARPGAARRPRSRAGHVRRGALGEGRGDRRRDLYDHTMDVIERAELLGGYRALPRQDIFDVEYWDLEQAKLRKGGKPPVFTGEVALVTGAASGIGKACVDALLARGAAVVGLDVDAAHRRRCIGATISWACAAM